MSATGRAPPSALVAQSEPPRQDVLPRTGSALPLGALAGGLLLALGAVLGAWRRGYTC